MLQSKSAWGALRKLDLRLQAGERNEKGNLADRFGIYPDTKHKQGANHLNT